MKEPHIIPIPLRADFTAHLHIPPNITQAEAKKIGSVLLAYAACAEQSGKVKTFVKTERFAILAMLTPR